MDDAAHPPLPEPPAIGDVRITEVLQALSDPSRLTMVKVLADGDWHPCGPDGWGLVLQKSTVSHHLKTLREAGLVEYRLRGRNKDARLRRADLDGRFPGLIAGVLASA